MKAVTHIAATGIRSLAVAIPFLFAVTRPPMSNFWPLVASALCAWVIVLVSLPRVTHPRALRDELAASLALGLLVAGLLASLIGLVQFFKGDVGWSPWIYQSTLGQAIGNLRQRNQQATLLLMSALALLLAAAHGLRDTGIAQRRGASTAMSVFAGSVPWVLLLLAMGSGVTASRTGAVEWLVVLFLLVCWRKSLGRTALLLGVAGLLFYLLSAWLLPEMLLRWTGVQMDGLFMRVADTSHRCTSRFTLWSNMLYLIGQKPLTGWGWGHLDYAHYMTQFPGERFCVLLDNAHNLPLHLAVELGLPVALTFCALVLIAIWRCKPWRETERARQLAWGVLALVGLHSMLEFPLWYGPFQLVTALAIIILLLPSGGVDRVQEGARAPKAVQAVMLLVCVLTPAALYLIASDYYRMSQLYQQQRDRPVQWRTLTPREVVETTRFFTEPAEFAWLTTSKVTPENAALMHDMAQRLLSYSPEPRVITRLIESARLLGLEGEAKAHLKRLEIAYPDAYRQFVASQPAGS